MLFKSLTNEQLLVKKKDYSHVNQTSVLDNIISFFIYNSRKDLVKTFQSAVKVNFHQQLRTNNL